MLASLARRSDKAVVRRVLRGRRDDFGVLVERYYGVVRAVVDARVPVAADAEDIAQDAFVRAYIKLDTLQDPARFGAWLTTIARNTALNWATRRKESVTLDTLPEAVAGSEEPAMETRERAQLVREHLNRLEEGPREILHLHYFAGKSLREIAALENISRDAAAKRLQRAREALGSELLRVLSENAAAPAPGRSRQTKSVMAAVLAANAAWKAGAQTGLGATPGGLFAGAGAKATAVFFVIALSMGGGWWMLRSMEQSEDRPPEVSGAAMASVPVKAQEETQAPEPMPVISPELPGHGPGKITVQCVTIEDKPFQGADVSVELVDWEAHEFPPEKTIIFHGVSDEFGRAVFENLPLGTYHDLALAEGRVGMNDSFLSERNLEDESRRVVMYPAATLRGKVVTPEGDPVPGAILYPVTHRIYPDDEISHTEMAGLRRITNEGGIFRYDAILKGGLKFYVLAPDGQQIITGFIDIPGLKAKIVLGRSGAVAGRAVHAETGAPIPDLEIRIRQGQRIKYATTTGADGAFFWSDVAPGDYLVQIGDAVLVPADDSRRLQVPDSGGIPECRLRFTQGGTVLGRVVDQETGAGIPGVPLYAGGESFNHQLEDEDRVTKADGSFAIHGLGSGMISVQTRNSVPGYAANYEEVMAEAKAGEMVEGLNLYLMPGAPVTGFVVDAQGDPVAGATVTGEAQGGASGRHGYEETVTEVDGSFRLDQLPGGGHVSLYAVKGSSRSEGNDNALPPEGIEEVIIALSLEVNGVIEGIAMTAARTPISRGEVYARLVSDTRAYQTQTGTDAIGYFKLEGLVPGEYLLTPEPWSPDYNNPCSGQTVRIQDGQHLKDVEVYCHPPGALHVSGRVLQPDGAPVLFAMVQEIPNGHRVITENSGYFDLGGLEAGPHTLQVSMQGFSPAVLEVEAGTQNLIVRLEHFAGLQGHVYDAATGQPITQCRVAYTQPGKEEVDARPPPYGELAVDNAAGRFTLRKLAADRLDLRISAPGYKRFEYTVDKLPGGTATALEFAMEPGEDTPPAHQNVQEANMVTVDGVQYIVVDGVLRSMEEAIPQ